MSPPTALISGDSARVLPCFALWTDKELAITVVSTGCRISPAALGIMEGLPESTTLWQITDDGDVVLLVPHSFTKSLASTQTYTVTSNGLKFRAQYLLGESPFQSDGDPRALILSHTPLKGQAEVQQWYETIKPLVQGDIVQIKRLEEVYREKIERVFNPVLSPGKQ